MRISVVLPAYNERDAIRHCIDSLLAQSYECGTEVQIVIVDDGSTDRTAEMLEALLVPYVRLGVRLGVGAAMRAGLRLADELEALSHRIHATPELCFQEDKAHGWLTEFLAGHGTKVERGVGEQRGHRECHQREVERHHFATEQACS